MKTSRMMMTKMMKIGRCDFHPHFAGLLKTALIGLVLCWGCSQPLEIPSSLSKNPDLGEVLILLPGRENSRLVYADAGALSTYRFGFVREDGESQPDIVLGPESESPVFSLQPGFWLITVEAYTPSSAAPASERSTLPTAGMTPTAQGFGTVRIGAGKRASLAITLTPTLNPAEAEQKKPGTFSWDFSLAGRNILSADILLWKMQEDGKFEFYRLLSLQSDEVAKLHYRDSVSLPPGYYRADLEIQSWYPYPGRSEVLQILSGWETRLPSRPLTAYPEVPEVSTIADLKTYLDGLPMNKPQTPYPIALRECDLSKQVVVTELYESLSRFVALDLRNCGGSSLYHLKQDTFPGKNYIVRLILPTAIESFGVYSNDHVNSFADCRNLEAIYAPGLKSIGRGSFAGCTALRTVYAPNTTSLGEDVTGTTNEVFKNCSSLIYLDLSKVNALPNKVFTGCSTLELLILGENPPTLSNQAVFDNLLPSCKIQVPAAALARYQGPGCDWTPEAKARLQAQE
jgi:hypothetical protein